jgi:hypothetical protein
MSSPFLFSKITKSQNFEGDLAMRKFIGFGLLLKNEKGE